MAELYLATVRDQVGTTVLNKVLSVLDRDLDALSGLEPEVARADLPLVHQCLAIAGPRGARATAPRGGQRQFVVSSEAYPEGLVWRTFNGHPAGATVHLLPRHRHQGDARVRTSRGACWPNSSVPNSSFRRNAAALSPDVLDLAPLRLPMHKIPPRYLDEVCRSLDGRAFHDPVTAEDFTDHGGALALRSAEQIHRDLVEPHRPVNLRGAVEVAP
ncbi:MAG: hypothetical protein ACRDRS_07980 [Pseudonocardiaceae bacterium]